MTTPIVLVPGFWLGAWAWDDVAGLLRDDGHQVTAVTLPGLGSTATDRAPITFDDHVDAICAAVAQAGPPVVLAVHSGAGFSGYAASDRVPDQLAAMVYVDTGPGKGAMDADFADVELALPEWDALGEDLSGISEEQLREFRERAVPQPGGVLRGSAELTDPARAKIPSTMICTSFTVEQYQQAAAEGVGFVAGAAELDDLTYVELPTSHWPMWSKSTEIAGIIGGIAASTAAAAP